MKKLMDKFIDLTSYVVVDEDGNEYKKPWTLEDFIMEQIFIVVGLIIGVIFF